MIRRKNAFILIVCSLLLAISLVICSCEKNDESEKNDDKIAGEEFKAEGDETQNDETLTSSELETKFEEDEKIGDDESGNSDFFEGKTPKDEILNQRAEKIESVKDALLQSQTTFEVLQDGGIIFKAPDNGEISNQYGGSKIELAGAEYLPKPNFTYYVSFASDNGEELYLELEDVAQEAILSYVKVLEQNGFSRDVTKSYSKDKTEFYFHAETSQAVAIDITSVVNHEVEISLFYESAKQS